MPTPAHRDGDLTAMRADEVRDANTFDAAEELIVRDFGVQPAAGHRCTDVSYIHAACAVAGYDVRDSDPRVRDAPKIGFNSGSGKRVSSDGQPLDSIASTSDSNHAGAPERRRERGCRQGCRVDHDRGPIVGDSGNRHVLLQLYSSAVRPDNA